MSKLIEVRTEETLAGTILYIGNTERRYAFNFKEFTSWDEVCLTLQSAVIAIKKREAKPEKPAPCPSHPHSKSDDMGCRACVLGWPAEEEEAP